MCIRYSRFFPILSVLVTGTIAPAVVSGQPHSQKTAATDKSSTTLRTRWGHPDLEGTWDAATLTPLERPTSADGKLVLTKEQAEAVARAERERNEADARQRSEPARPHCRRERRRV